MEAVWCLQCLLNVCAFIQKAELNELQSKNSENLWREDLAVFIEELDVSMLALGLG